MLELTWAQFDDNASELSRLLRHQSFTGVCGVPRGGLVLAVALSHRLGLSLLERPREGCLVVDDIYETGETLAAITVPNCTFAVWVTKKPTDWVLAGQIVPKDKWVVFPWEDKTKARADMESYYASR